jgi:hypothetical protein
MCAPFLPNRSRSYYRLAIAVKQEITIRFGQFAWPALEERAAKQEIQLEELIALALSYYESELDSGRAATTVPRFRRAPEPRETRTLEIEIDERCMQRIHQEARRRRVPWERVCEHAALLLLADLDAGRVAERVVRSARSDPGPRRSPGGAST